MFVFKVTANGIRSKLQWSPPEFVARGHPPLRSNRNTTLTLRCEATGTLRSPSVAKQPETSLSLTGTSKRSEEVPEIPQNFSEPPNEVRRCQKFHRISQSIRGEAERGATKKPTNFCPPPSSIK